jgi:hypothetical protein
MSLESHEERRVNMTIYKTERHQATDSLNFKNLSRLKGRKLYLGKCSKMYLKSDKKKIFKYSKVKKNFSIKAAIVSLGTHLSTKAVRRHLQNIERKQIPIYVCAIQSTRQN